MTEIGRYMSETIGLVVKALYDASPNGMFGLQALRLLPRHPHHVEEAVELLEAELA
jgi:hypothetical protein